MVFEKELKIKINKSLDEVLEKISSKIYSSYRDAPTATILGRIEGQRIVLTRNHPFSDIRTKYRPFLICNFKEVDGEKFLLCKICYRGIWDAFKPDFIYPKIFIPFLILLSLVIVPVAVFFYVAFSLVAILGGGMLLGIIENPEGWNFAYSLILLIMGGMPWLALCYPRRTREDEDFLIEYVEKACS